MSGIIYGKWGEQFEEHQYKRHDFGTKMIMSDSVWVYAQMGATVGVAGSLYQSEAVTANWNSKTVDTARAAGAEQISATLGGTATVQNEFDEGYVVIEDDAGEGYLYHIARGWKDGDSNAKASTGAVQTVNLRPGEKVQVALTTATTLSFFKNKLDEVVVHPSPPNAAVVGVAMRAVSSPGGIGYYCWLQVKGPASVKADGTLVPGNGVRAAEGSADGAVAALDYSESGRDEVPLGSVIDIGTDTEHAAIDLDIPGY